MLEGIRLPGRTPLWVNRSCKGQCSKHSLKTASTMPQSKALPICSTAYLTCKSIYTRQRLACRFCGGVQSVIRITVLPLKLFLMNWHTQEAKILTSCAAHCLQISHACVACWISLPKKETGASPCRQVEAAASQHISRLIATSVKSLKSRWIKMEWRVFTRWSVRVTA